MSHQMVFGETGKGRASSAARSMSPLHMGRRRAGGLLTAGWLFSCFRTTPNIDDMAGNPLADRGSVWRYAGVWRGKKKSVFAEGVEAQGRARPPPLLAANPALRRQQLAVCLRPCAGKKKDLPAEVLLCIGAHLKPSRSDLWLLYTCQMMAQKKMPMSDLSFKPPETIDIYTFRFHRYRFAFLHQYFRPKPDPQLCSPDWDTVLSAGGHQRVKRFTHTVWGHLQVHNSNRYLKPKVIEFILINRRLRINHVFVLTRHKKHVHSHQKQKTLRLIGGKKSSNHPNFIRT